MAQNSRMLDCSNCQSKTEHLEYPPNHLLQLALAVVAGVVGWFLAGHVAGAVVGFMGWVIYVWCSLIVFQKESECRVCGTPQKADKFAKRALVVILCFPFVVLIFMLGAK